MELVAIDLATFLVGISTVLMVRIPQVKTPSDRLDGTTSWQQLFWGIGYIRARPSLLAITTIFCLYWRQCFPQPPQC